MDIFSVITLCGGLAFFLFGMSTMSSSLEKLAGGRLEQPVSYTHLTLPTILLV